VIKVIAALCWALSLGAGVYTINFILANGGDPFGAGIAAAGVSMGLLFFLFFLLPVFLMWADDRISILRGKEPYN
jgi:hypothetical protein